MRSVLVVIESPTINHPAGLLEAQERVSIQQFVAQLAVEALDVAVLPGTARLDSTSSFATNGATWMHVAATHDGATIRMYINGAMQSSKAVVFSIKTNDTPLVIGAEDTGGRSMRGAIDDVLVVIRALSASEILSAYQGTFPSWVNSPPIQSG